MKRLLSIFLIILLLTSSLAVAEVKTKGNWGMCNVQGTELIGSLWLGSAVDDTPEDKNLLSAFFIGIGKKDLVAFTFCTFDFETLLTMDEDSALYPAEEHHLYVLCMRDSGNVDYSFFDLEPIEGGGILIFSHRSTEKEFVSALLKGGEVSLIIDDIYLEKGVTTQMRFNINTDGFRALYDEYYH